MDMFALVVALCMVFAGSGVIAFTRSQYNRWQARILVWLSIPFFTVALLYFHAAFAFPEIEVMRFLARWGFILLGASCGLVMHMTAFIQRGHYVRRA